MTRFRLFQTMLGVCLGMTLCFGQACTVRSGTGDDDDTSDEKEPDAGGGDSEKDAATPAPDAGMDPSEPDVFDSDIKRPPPSVSRTEPDAQPDSVDATSAGMGDLETDTAQADDDGDSSWEVEFDVDGDGTDDKLTIVYDDETKLQYTSWQGVIEGFCLDDSDANASFTLIYDHATMKEILIWSSDCSEDEDLTYGCGVAANGELRECGICSLVGSKWTCDEITEPVDLVAYECVCEVTCDGEPNDEGLAADLCDLPDETESASDLVVPECVAEFAGECDEVACDCSCTETATVCE